MASITSPPAGNPVFPGSIPIHLENHPSPTTSSEGAAAAAASSAPEIHTYHCICNQLVLASTHTLSELRRRQAPGLDKAYILPLPPLPRRRSSSSEEDGGAEDDDDDNENSDDEEQEERRADKSSGDEAHISSLSAKGGSGGSKHLKTTIQKSKPKRAKKPKDSPSKTGEIEKGYSLLLSTTLDRRPVIVRREDGFEKRWLWRCARCRVVVGYQLDSIHFTSSTGSGGSGTAGDAGGALRGNDEIGIKSSNNAKGNEEGKDREGEAGDQKQDKDKKLMYLLPGGLLSTQDMASGKTLGEEDVEIKIA